MINKKQVQAFMPAHEFLAFASSSALGLTKKCKTVDEAVLAMDIDQLSETLSRISFESGCDESEDDIAKKISYKKLIKKAIRSRSEVLHSVHEIAE